MIRSLLLIALSLLAISSGVPQWRERPVTTEAPVELLKEYMCKVIATELRANTRFSIINR